MKTKIAILMIITLILATLACASNAPQQVGVVPNVEQQNTSEPIPMPTAIQAIQAPQEYQIGDIIKIGDTNIVVLGWSDLPAGEIIEPHDGFKFIGVDMIIVNNSTNSVNISAMLQMSLKDSTGQKYDYDFLASSSGAAAPDGEILPGEKVRGQAAFEIPLGATGLVFVYDDSIFGTGKIFVYLGDAPYLVAVPAELEGESQQQIFNIGDVVSIGGIDIFINEVTFPTGNEYSSPELGNRFILVDVSITNNRSEAASISSYMQMELKDSTGQTYTMDFTAQAVSNATGPDGELAPGEMIRGQVGYQVPEAASGLLFVYDASLFGEGKVFISLGF